VPGRRRRALVTAPARTVTSTPAAPRQRTPPTTDGKPGKFSRRYRVTWATDDSYAGSNPPSSDDVSGRPRTILPAAPIPRGQFPDHAART
jgi:hypothetical protein